MRRSFTLGLAVLLATAFTATCLAGCLGSGARAEHACCAEGVRISAPSSDCCSQLDGTRTDTDGPIAAGPCPGPAAIVACVSTAAPAPVAPRITASPPLVLRI